MYRVDVYYQHKKVFESVVKTEVAKWLGKTVTYISNYEQLFLEGYEFVDLRPEGAIECYKDGDLVATDKMVKDLAKKINKHPNYISSYLSIVNEGYELDFVKVEPVYALYDRDDLVMIGNEEEILANTDLNSKSLEFYCSQVAKNRYDNGRNNRIVERWYEEVGGIK